MPERKRLLVTGATGFLGSHLSYRLLEQGHRVLALARGSRNVSACERVVDTLKSVAGSEEALSPMMDRLDVVEGDISQPGFGLNDDARSRIISATDEIWHCAASLSFAEEDREEIFHLNVGGTEKLLEIVEQIPGRRLHHVSTAYVAGDRSDVVKETDIDVGQRFKNPYEESKFRSELMIAEAHRNGLARASVYRPSIVIGDSKTGRVTHFHGVYAFIRGLWSVLERLRRRLPHESVISLPLRVSGSKSTTLNFVPIDYVVDGMVEIGNMPSSLGKTYHLTNDTPTPNSLWLSDICRIMRVEGVELTGEESFEKTPMTKLEMLFQKQMAFYYMYLSGEPKFDARNTHQALTGTGIECPPVTGEFTEKMMGWYLNYLRSNGDR